MTRLLAHVRTNIVAYLALFVALGGSSYAAFSLPPGSVGAQQIRNHAIDPVKLNPKTITATVTAWAVVVWDGAWHVQSSPADIHVARTALGEVVRWRHTRFARKCFASVTPQANFPGPSGSSSIDGYVTTVFDGPAGRLQIDGLAPDGTHQVQDVNLLIFCPSSGG